MKNSRE